MAGLVEKVGGLLLRIFRPGTWRKRWLAEERRENMRKLKADFKTKGYHVWKSKNISVVRRANGDRIILFNENAGDDSAEVFFPENWEKIGERISATRNVARIRSLDRKYFVKDISPFRPPRKEMGNTRLTEARILLHLQKEGFEPERVAAVVVRPGCLPALVTHSLKGRKADLTEVWKLKSKLEEAGITPNDLVGRFAGHSFGAENINAVQGETTHPIDVEFYELLKKVEPPKYPTKKVRPTLEEQLRRLKEGEWPPIGKQYDPRLRRWKRETDVQKTLELRVYKPSKGGTGEWVPVEEHPSGQWKRYVAYDKVRKKWVLPQEENRRWRQFVNVASDTGRWHYADSLVRKIRSADDAEKP